MPNVIGFTAGLFDLFNVGDLDLLRRAGDGCDRLIAGVATDELAEAAWGVRPFVPLIERAEILGNVRHVAEVVPMRSLDLRESWQRLGFSVVFAGPDLSAVLDLDRAFAGSRVRVVRPRDLEETRSPALRTALGGRLAHSSVA